MITIGIVMMFAMSEVMEDVNNGVVIQNVNEEIGTTNQKNTPAEWNLAVVVNEEKNVYGEIAIADGLSVIAIAANDQESTERKNANIALIRNVENGTILKIPSNDAVVYGVDNLYLVELIL